MLAALTGIKRSPTQVRCFSNTLGLQRRKVGLLPAKGDPEVQEEYQKKVGATLSEAQAGKRTVFLWMPRFCLRRVSWIPLVLRPVLDQSAEWAERFNVLGANAITYEVITVTNRPTSTPKCLPIAEEAGSFELTGADHPGPGQCALSAFALVQSVAGHARHRVAVFTGLRAQFELN